MKKHNKMWQQKFIMGMFASVLVLFAQCSRNTLDVVGGGSDTEVSGRIVSANGVGNSGVCVMLINATYIPAFESTLSTIKLDTTDSNGKYHFTHVNTGVYNIQAQHTANVTRYLLPAINVSGNTTVTVADDSLRTPATLRVFLPNGISLLSGYLYVPGTLISKYFSAGAIAVEFDSIPQGLLPSIQCKNYESSLEQSLFGNVLVDSSGTTVLHSANSWAQSSRIFFNTTPSGVDVSGNLYGFPVLVRLTKDLIDLSKANADGSDIRFAKANGSPLSYEIEQWDLATGQAAIWVKIDTIFGNDNSHYINMFWGASTGSATVSQSNGAAVFDTANGFQGVWHMGQTGNSSVLDATANQYNGTPYNMNAASQVAGEIGNAQKFDGISSYIEMNGTATGKLNFPQNGTYAISAWVLTDTFDLNYHTIASKGDFQYDLEIIPSDEWQFAECNDGKGWDMTTARSPEKTWTYLTGVRNGSREYLYINGSLVDSTISLSAATATRYTGFDVMIGKTRKMSGDTTGYFFKGMIDEVRIASVAWGTDWIKLCYMNQKAGDALVAIKP
jgi:hypothetical protein